MVCSQTCSSLEVSRASFTSRRSSNSRWMDEIHHQIWMCLGYEARRFRFTTMVQRLTNLSAYHIPYQPVCVRTNLWYFLQSGQQTSGYLTKDTQLIPTLCLQEVLQTLHFH